MASDHRWTFNRAKFRRAFLLLFFAFVHQNLNFCLSLNREAVALMKFRERIEEDPFGALLNWKGEDFDHCSWFGVNCSDGKVVILHLKDLCLRGTLAPELGKLTHLKSLILRNNSFSGNIPKEIAELQELEFLDLGYNNLTEPFPSEFHNNSSFITILLDNNSFIDELQDFSELQLRASEASCDCRSAPWNDIQSGDLTNRRLLQSNPPKGNEVIEALPQSPSPSPSSPPPPPQVSARNAQSPPSSPPEIPRSPAKLPKVLEANITSPPPPLIPREPSPPPPEPSPPPPAPVPPSKGTKRSSRFFLFGGVFGGLLFVSVIVIATFFFRNKKVYIKPWATGASGQLQKALITGVPKLKLSELQAACEDFSNIIGSFSNGTIYKGTLSSRAEIAVTSMAVRSREDWSTNLETQFKEQIDMLSKVNHKNFLNLIGYCQEDEPFARMMVFEYAPNGMLFEHLHVQEAEHLDWKTRLRIAMGVAYCLDHMHQLSPPISHKNLESSSVFLTEDNAAKIADLTFLMKHISPAKEGSSSRELLVFPPFDPPSNIYSFGAILYEMVTGTIPDSERDDSLPHSLSLYLQGNKPVREIVDPTLKSFQEDVLERLLEVIQQCVHPDPSQRPTMRDVVVKLREITRIAPDGAMPRLSPSWWTELESVSTEGN